MWIFGYGSLIWNPGFEYLDSKVGFVEGYVRRFWQGNDFHRGNKEKVGRVATLVKEEKGITWGRAFLLGPDAESSLTYLDTREAKLGGYATSVITFHPKGDRDDPFPALLYMALPSSNLYLGPAPLPDMATDIADAVGHCGYNAEYLIRLVNFMKEQVPEAWDEHLYHLDHLVRSRLKSKNLSVEDIMGEDCPAATAGLAKSLMEKDEQDDSPPPSPPRGFASTVPSRKLRCMNI